MAPVDTATTEIEGVFVPDKDPQWMLVLRIVASSYFAKSERLSSFLLFVCKLALLGRTDEINEQNIGCSVFGRTADYDTSVDGIVRSHATRLRQRLEQYFAEEGLHEPLILEIPPGAYVPVFTARALTALPSRQFDATAAEALPEPAVEKAHKTSGISFQEMEQKRPGLLPGMLFAVMLLWTVVSVGYLATHPRQIAGIRAEWAGAHHPFWTQLFNKDISTLVVNADSALVMLQDLRGRSITLEEYTNGDYKKSFPAGLSLPGNIVDNLASRRYTSFVDLDIVQKLFRVPGIDLDRTTFRYARDVRQTDLKDGNIVLVGCYESTPWVQLFEPKMNFYFENNRASRVFSIVNRAPRGNEQARYDQVSSDPEHTVYGLVAFQPTLSGSGNVLILEGQTVAGTEAAADFALNDAYLVPFLNKIRGKNGTIPHFELLLRSKSLGGDASRLDVLAYRVEGQ